MVVLSMRGKVRGREIVPFLLANPKAQRDLPFRLKRNCDGRETVLAVQGDPI
ncbi:hypothetical protein KIN_29060 [Litoreibacter roseus]|uniref:Uncharacterized protein n=1 Tax=Litoreibacter roseus TaxID=2601869 RepID=A0A6N6JKW6_9RHOB|nr:hypothetical protein KIN_29060 [Litoreibacter roseus]